MSTLAETLEATTPVSPLLRKARRLGVCNVNDMLALAASRGCLHYAPSSSVDAPLVSLDKLDDNELTILLLVGENTYEPSAIRCAAQLARSTRIDPKKLASLAVMEKCQRVLSYIARAGVEHDTEGIAFWQDLLQRLTPTSAKKEPHLPHWTRFVSMPGYQRFGTAPTRWLVPSL